MPNFPTMPRYQPRSLGGGTPASPRVPLSFGRSGSPAVNPDALTAGLKARAQAYGAEVHQWGAVARLGETITKVGERILDINQTTLSSRNLRKLEEAQIKFLQEAENRNDYTNLEADYLKLTSGLREEYSEGLIGPYAAQFESTFDLARTRGQQRVNDLARRKAVDDGRAELNASFEQFKLNVLNDPLAADLHEKKIMRHITMAAQQGLITKQAAQVLGSKAESYTSFVALMGAAQTNPRAVMKVNEQISTGSQTPPKDADKKMFNDIRRLDLPERTQVLNMAAKAIKATEVSQQDIAYNTVQDMPGLRGDLQAQKDYLRDADNQRKLGITGKQAATIIGWLDNAQDDQKEKTELAQREGELREHNTFWEHMNAGNPVAAMQALEGFIYISPEKIAELKDKARERYVATDPIVRADTYRKIHSGEIKHELEIMRLVNNGLDYQDAKNLTNDFKARKKYIQENTGVGRLDYVDQASRTFRQRFAKDRDLLAKESVFLEQLDVMMKKEGVNSFDSRVNELVDSLLKRPDPSGLGNKLNYAFLVRAEQQARTGQPMTEPLRDRSGRVVVDPDLPELDADDTIDVWKVLEQTGIQNPTREQKQLAWAQVDIGEEAFSKTVALLASRGKQITAETVRMVYRLHKNQIDKMTVRSR